MNLDPTGIGFRSSASMVVGASALGVFQALPDSVRVLLAALLLAFTNYAIEWLRHRRAVLQQRRQELERDDRGEAHRPPSEPGYVRAWPLALLAALALAACGGRYFVRVFSHETLGKCVASGYQRNFDGDPGFVGRTGALQCIAPLSTSNDRDVSGFLFDEHLKDAGSSVDAEAADTGRVLQGDHSPAEYVFMAREQQRDQ